MDSQELNRACELAFLVAREGVEQDPPVDPPASMRMFLYVRQFPQRALTVARQVLTEDAEFRAKVAAVATIDNVGEVGLAWLQGDGTLSEDFDGGDDHKTFETPVADVAIENDQPVTKETIRSEMDELKNLVGQLSQERAAVDSEVEELALRLEESDDASGLRSLLSSAVSSDSAAKGSASLTAQIRSLHTDLKQARADRDHAQEAKELAILEHAELAEELEHLRALASTAQVQLAELESKVRDVSTEKDQLASEKDRLSVEREALAEDKDLLSVEVTAAESRLAESEERLGRAQADLDTLTAELEDVRSNAGASVHDLQAAVAARAALESHVDALGGAHTKARAEMERVNAALDDKTASDLDKIETLKAALAAVTAERDALQGKLDDVRATVSTLQGEMAKLESNFSGAESVATAFSERMEELQTSVDAFPAESSIEVNLSAFDTPDMPVLEAAPAALIGTHPESNEVAGDESSGTIADESDRTVESDTVVVEDSVVEDSVVEDSVVEDSVVEDSVVDRAAAPANEEDHEPQSVSGDDQANELIPDEIFAPDSADAAEDSDSEVVQAEPETSPLVMSDAAEDFTAGLLHETPPRETEAPGQAPATDDIDEVHALVAETVASFEPSDTDNLPGSGVSASDAANAGVSTGRGGLTSLFTSFIPGGGESDVSESEVEAGEDPDDGHGLGLFAVAAAGTAGAATARVAGNDDSQGSVSAPGLADPDAETAVDDDQAITGGVETAARRGPIVVPEEAASDPLKTARFVVHTEDAVLLIDGDPVAAMGWPSVDRVEQRRNLVHYLSVMAGTSGASPDVLFDRDFGVDRLPDSRSVRVRVTNEGGSVSAQIVSLIDTYPKEWPVVVVTDNMDLAAEAAMKGATLLDNGQLLDLFIAP